MESLSTKKRQRRSKQKTGSKIKLDFLTAKFSKELVLNVFSFLSLQDLIQCTAVSAEWSFMANDEMVIVRVNSWNSPKETQLYSLFL